MELAHSFAASSRPKEWNSKNSQSSFDFQLNNNFHLSQNRKYYMALENICIQSSLLKRGLNERTVAFAASYAIFFRMGKRPDDIIRLLGPVSKSVKSFESLTKVSDDEKDYPQPTYCLFGTYEGPLLSLKEEENTSQNLRLFKLNDKEFVACMQKLINETSLSHFFDARCSSYEEGSGRMTFRCSARGGGYKVVRGGIIVNSDFKNMMPDRNTKLRIRENGLEFNTQTRNYDFTDARWRTAISIHCSVVSKSQVDDGIARVLKNVVIEPEKISDKPYFSIEVQRLSFIEIQSKDIQHLRFRITDVESGKSVTSEEGYNHDTIIRCSIFVKV